jgi:protein transport protein SEC61 subunit alpha
MIDVNMQSKEDRELFMGTTKMFGMLLTFGQALGYTISGMYGPIGQLGFINSTLIILQLCIAGFLVIMLDELL